MTTRRTHRCQHCQNLYEYVESGDIPKFNDDRWCPSCTEVVRTALAAVPRKYELIWVATDLVDLATLLQWEQEWEREQIARDGVRIKRLSTPLIDTTTWQSDRSGFVRGKSDKTRWLEFRYRFWPGRESEAVIELNSEREIATGKVSPCRIR